MSHKTTNMKTQRKRIYSPSLEELASTSWHFTEITKYHNSAIELADKIPDHNYDKVGQFILEPVAKRILQPRCQSPLSAHEALPVHVNAKRERIEVESPAERLRGDPEWEGFIVKLLRDILYSHDGFFSILYSDNGFFSINANDLKEFIEQHPEFAWEPAGKKGMIIKWARSPVKRTRLSQCNRILRLPTEGPRAAA